MFDYVELFQNAAPENDGDRMPNRPALLLYFGDIAVRSRKDLLSCLMPQIPQAYHEAVVEGALCSADEAGEVSCLPIPESLEACSFGDFATSWLGNESNRKQLSDFLRDRIHQTTQKETAIAMTELDIYLIVGNDGVACELWPSVVKEIRQLPGAHAAIRWHVIWLYCEQLPQPRDAAMCALIDALQRSNTEAPEYKAIPMADQLQEVDVSYTLISDRNESNLSSDIVWKQNCCGIAGLILLEMFSHHSGAECNTCSMFDAVYPDAHWSAGFQLSALLKVKEQLTIRKNNALRLFIPMLEKAWDIPASNGNCLVTNELVKKISNSLPDVKDLRLIPVEQDPDVSALKKSKDVVQCMHLLYGERFRLFLDDALHGTSMEQLQQEMQVALRRTLNDFAHQNGPMAASQLLDDKEGLPAQLLKLAEESAYKVRSELAHAVSPFANVINHRKKEIIENYGPEAIRELKGKAVAQIAEALCEWMEDEKPAFDEKASALNSAIDGVESELNKRLALLDTKYHQSIRKYAQDKKLFPAGIETDNLVDISEGFSHEDPKDSLLRALAKINCKNNALIASSLNDTLMRLGYNNGINELKAALDGLCKAPVFTPVLLSKKDVYIMPSGGTWSNGSRVYGLIRIYSSENANLLASVGYLSDLLQLNGMQVAAGNNLPVYTAESNSGPSNQPEYISKVDVLEAEIGEIGSLQYTRPNMLAKFEWPDTSVELIRLHLEGMLDCGRRVYNETIDINLSTFLRRGGVLLADVRITGSCIAELHWTKNGEKYVRKGWLKGEPVHVSRTITEERGKYVIGLSTSENITDLHNYVLLRVKKPDGLLVDYRLPVLKNGEAIFEKQYCHGKMELILAKDEWKEYISF